MTHRASHVEPLPATAHLRIKKAPSRWRAPCTVRARGFLLALEELLERFLADAIGAAELLGLQALVIDGSHYVFLRDLEDHRGLCRAHHVGDAARGLGTLSALHCPGCRLLHQVADAHACADAGCETGAAARVL